MRMKAGAAAIAYAFLLSVTLPPPKAHAIPRHEIVTYYGHCSNPTTNGWWEQDCDSNTSQSGTLSGHWKSVDWQLCSWPNTTSIDWYEWCDGYGWVYRGGGTGQMPECHCS